MSPILHTFLPRNAQVITQYSAACARNPTSMLQLVPNIPPNQTELIETRRKSLLYNQNKPTLLSNAGKCHFIICGLN